MKTKCHHKYSLNKKNEKWMPKWDIPSNNLEPGIYRSPNLNVDHRCEMWTMNVRSETRM